MDQTMTKGVERVVGTGPTLLHVGTVNIQYPFIFGTANIHVDFFKE